MAAWIDSTCERCGHRFGYVGDANRPRLFCPTCTREGSAVASTATPLGPVTLPSANRKPPAANPVPCSPAPGPCLMVMPFGKYRGKTLGEIADADILYLDWLNGQEIKSPALLKAIAQICADRSHEIDRAMGED